MKEEGTGESEGMEWETRESESELIKDTEEDW